MTEFNEAIARLRNAVAEHTKAAKAARDTARQLRELVRKEPGRGC